MITDSEKAFIRIHAYLPEHILEYGEAISGSEPYLFDNFLCYIHERILIFVGYPLEGIFVKKKAQKTIEDIVRRYKVERIAVISPEEILRDVECIGHISDSYYRYDLMDCNLPSKVKNMVARGKKELFISEGKELTEEHKRLIIEFLESHRLEEDSRYIFERIPLYLKHSSSALIINAVNKEGELIAFDIVDFGSKNYVFYMFNIVSRRHKIPGASDFLLYEIIERAKNGGYRFVNLGLGINKGVTFFKEKWGGKPFLRYEYCVYSLIRKNAMEDLLQKL